MKNSWSGAHRRFGFASFELMARMKALVPQDRWKACIRATIHSTLARGQKIAITSEHGLARMMTEAWLEPIDFAQFTSARHLVGLETVHLAYCIDREAHYVQSVANAITVDFGA